MCGIVGVFPIGTNHHQKIAPELRRALAFWLHNELLYWTVKRGKDATGMVATFGEHYDTSKESAPYFWTCIKQPVDTEDFFNNDGTDKRYAGQKKNANITYLMDRMAVIPRPLLHIIGHARLGTIGSETNPNNNHPILINNIIGVHNGGVKNQDRIYEKHSIKPVGEVDSEAIMHLFNEIAPDRELTQDDINFVCERIEGPRAVLAFNRKAPNKIAMFRDGERPIEVSMLEELGLLVVHSERDFLRQAMNSYTRLRMIYSKSMPGTHELPLLREISATVNANEGTIIDLEKPFVSGTLKEWMNLEKTPDTLSDYKKTYSTGSTSTTYANGGSSTTGAFNNTKSAIGFTPVPAPAPTTTEADVEDNSIYTEDGAPIESESITVASHQVMDDAGEDLGGPSPENMGLAAMASIVEDDASNESGDSPDDDEDDEEDLVAGAFTYTQLRQMAEDTYLKPEYADNKHSALHRLRGKMAKQLAIANISEEDAVEAATMVYPEFMSDGYVLGFSDGAMFTEQIEQEKLENLATGLEEATTEINTLKDQLDIEQKALREATKYISNIKGFLMASLIAKNLISVNPMTGEVEFDEDIEELLDMDRMFKGVNVTNVRKLFGQKEKKIISSGMVAELRNSLVKSRTVS